jgi:hypothetical protein
VFYVTDLRHFEGVELDPEAPGPAVRLALYLRRIVRAATALQGRGPQPTALPCRRRPGRVPCPGHLIVELHDVPSEIRWQCPSCSEGGVIDGWQGALDDLSARSQSDDIGSPRRVVIPEKAYAMLLGELVLDHECEGMIYSARPHPEGVELLGTEDDFEELLSAVAAESNHAPTRKSQRRWDAIFECIDPSSGSSWLETSTDIFVEELALFELVASRTAIAEALHQKLETVALALGVTEQLARVYVTEENVRELARHTAVSLVDEQPGAELLDQPRTIPASIHVIGRSFTALAEVAHVRVLNEDAVGAHGALQVISLLGHLLDESPSTQSSPILLPQAALTRSARLLEATAQMIGEGAKADIPDESRKSLAEAFSRDAAILRALVSEHGASSGPLDMD